MSAMQRKPFSLTQDVVIRSPTVKICYIVDTEVGALWAFEQLRGLRDEYGFQVAIVVANRQGTLADKLRCAGIPFYALSFASGSLIGILTLPFKVIGLA